MISAPQKSAGKTTVSLGILNNLVEDGISVKSFKKGPDYIDPMWLKLASGSDCHNLDPYLMGNKGCIDTFVNNIHESEMALIEGNHGLHDGMSLDGSDSSAGLANILHTPVLMVLDSRGMNRGAAAVVKGMQKMIPEPVIAGVILNHVRSSRQEEKQKASIEKFCGVPVIGAIPQDDAVKIPERHLGLTTVDETLNAQVIIRNVGELIAKFCDMEAIKSIFRESTPLEIFPKKISALSQKNSVKIGVFNDPAFCFYYPENLEDLRNKGVELVFVNALQENCLPDMDGLYIGGGFPEFFFEELSANRKLLFEVQERIRSGIPVYAECGGLIYLCESAYYNGKKYPLAGVLPFEIGFQQKPVGYGYLSLKSRCRSKWFEKNILIRAHEFHYSKPILGSRSKTIDTSKFARNSSRGSYQFNVTRGYGIDGKQDGFLQHNLFASFAHLHASANPQWAQGFVALASEYQH